MDLLKTAESMNQQGQQDEALCSTGTHAENPPVQSSSYAVDPSSKWAKGENIVLLLLLLCVGVYICILLTTSIPAISPPDPDSTNQGLLQMDQSMEQITEKIHSIREQLRQEIQNEEDEHALQHKHATQKMKKSFNTTSKHRPYQPTTVHQNEDRKFIVPRVVWVYLSNYEETTTFVKRCMMNLEHFTRLSNYDLRLINGSNYRAWLSPSRQEKVDAIMRKLNERSKQKNQGQLIKELPNLERRLITLELLAQNGGIAIDSNMLLTEDLSWLEDINDNPYPNRGDGLATAKYVAFFDIDRSSPLGKQPKKNIQHASEQYMWRFPGLKWYFLAGIAGGEYLNELLSEFYFYLMDPARRMAEVLEDRLQIGNVQKDAPYSEALTIAHHIVLQRQQFEIDNIYPSKQYIGLHSIDYYGVHAINCRYFPQKLQFTFENAWAPKYYINMGSLTREELEQTVGPLRYVLSMPFEWDVNNFIEEATRQGPKNRYAVHPQSLIAQLLYMDGDCPFLFPEVEQPFIDEQPPQWESLPRIIWLYWDSGFKNSGLENQLSINTIRKYGQMAGFNVTEVNSSNVGQYVDRQFMDDIDQTISKAKINTFKQTKTNFIRKLLVAKYGGIYMDVSYIPVQSLQWIIDIARYPSQYIYNRYGQLPRILMLFHPHFGQPFEWTYDPEANTKQMLLTAYQNNLFIADKGQSFFYEWYSEYRAFLLRPYEESMELMRWLGVFDYRWTSEKNVYLASMDSCKIMMAKRQRMVETRMKLPYYQGAKSAPQYYGLWSMSGYRGQQKFRSHTNYDNTNYIKTKNSDNPFFWRHSLAYVEGVVGRVRHWAKLYGMNVKYLEKVLLQSYPHWESEVHPDSFFMRCLYDPVRYEVEVRLAKFKLIERQPRPTK